MPGRWVLVGLLGLVAGCSNSPYPGKDETTEVVHYRAFSIPPKDFDPSRSYTQPDAVFLSLCYERLLSYDYLKRPVELIPELAMEVPEPEVLTGPDGEPDGVRYRFALRRGVRFIDDPCFPEGQGREMTARDFEFAFKRAADPDVNCPVVDALSHIRGFMAFRERVTALRKAQPEDDPLPVSELYRRAGDLEGIVVTGDYGLDMTMTGPFPQMLYWLAMRFISAIPYEAVERYDGSQGAIVDGEPMEFGKRPVGTGAYRFKWDEYDRESKIVMVRNESWWGFGDHPAAPGTRYPMQPASPEDVDSGAWRPERAGDRLARIGRIEWNLERETVSFFSKFVQGYYDCVPLIPVSVLDQVVQGGVLTPELEARGIRMIRDLIIHVSYIGFNMQDDTLGAPLKFKDPALEANREEALAARRKLRQALSLAVDSDEYIRIFWNRLGLSAQTPIPPGLFGYDPDYRNPYRQYDPELTRARALLAEAGYPNGIDPDTGQPLELTIVAGNTDTRARALYNFFVDCWARIGVKVTLDASDYNSFQTKIYEGAFQIFYWGWLADYPDPENFLFLLYGPNSCAYGPHRPNHSRFEDERYDRLYSAMATLANHESATWETPDPETGEPKMETATRGEIIRRMVTLLEEECPWIPIFHEEKYYLNHAWMHDVKPFPITDSNIRFHDVDAPMRTRLQRERNLPIRWPAVVLAAAVAAFLVPAIRTMIRERR